MNDKISKPNADRAFFNSRLDEIHMSEYERLMAKAHLARAEAAAEMLAAAAKGIRRAYKALTARSPRHAAPSAS